MKIKKYIAPSMPEAMKQIRADLGIDAVILNSKVVYQGGLFGLFKRKNIEVIAALDPQQEMSELPPRKEKEMMKIKPTLKEQNEQGKQVKETDYFMNQDKVILKELQDLKHLVHLLSKEPRQEMASMPEPIQKIYARLLEQDLKQELLNEIVEQLVHYFFENRGKLSYKDVENFLTYYLVNRFSDYSFGGISAKKKYINVIGPTGVGKTTTLAKIASDAMLNLNKKIAFITTDTYRIGAVEQLKTYAKILNVPIEVCYNLKDFKQAAERFQSYDLVFIDTAGRNFRNEEYIAELTTIIDFKKDMETFLVFSLASKEKDMHEIYAQFSQIPISKFIFTKLDETSNYGALVNLPLTYQKGIAYITNGQDVPDDIIEATPIFIVKHLLGAEQNG